MPAHAQRMSSLLVADKEFASCRIESRACDAGRGGGLKGEGARCWGRLAQAARTRRTRPEGLGQGTRGERTSNMRAMFVTRDVSKLTGWLKAAAFCRVESRACDAGRGVQAGRRGS